MFLSVKEMEVRKVRFEETFQPGEIDFSADAVKQSGPLRAEGVAELLANTDGEVRIKGLLSVTMEAECDRCLGRAQFPLDTGFDLFYRPSQALAVGPEVAIDEGEAEMGFYTGLGMELEDVLREQILLLLPMQRVCSADCKGICPVCGGNRNETSCDCREEPANDRWSALRKISRG
ncbi:MAG TPA: DUF177 domain-containing protein [Bryobacteraceae bacterium]|nr:DUF177 domain-containing protein [Bryobacteraceae bacterium]